MAAALTGPMFSLRPPEAKSIMGPPAARAAPKGDWLAAGSWSPRRWGGGLGDVVVAVVDRRRGGDGDGWTGVMVLRHHRLQGPPEHVIGAGGHVLQRVGDGGDVAAGIVGVTGGMAQRVGHGLRVPGHVVAGVVGGVAVGVLGGEQLAGGVVGVVNG